MPSEPFAYQDAEGAKANARPSLWRRFTARTTFALVAMYTLTIVVIALWMRFAGVESWAITFLLFGPRWLLAVPLAVLVPLALLFRRGSLWLLGLAGLVLLGPVLGFEPHFLGQGAPADLRVMTCNLDVQEYDVAKLAKVIADERPDVVALQESKIMPPDLVWPEGWHFLLVDEHIVASRWPVREVKWVQRPHVNNKPSALWCTIQMPQREVQFITLHFLTPRPGLEAVLNQRSGIDLSRVGELKTALAEQAEESQAVAEFVNQIPGSKIVCGDFNMPVESPMYRRDWKSMWNAFSTAGLGFGFSKLTEEDGLVYGTRIDHILYTPPFDCVRSWLAPEVGSDHRPVMADFVLE